MKEKKNSPQKQITVVEDIRKIPSEQQQSPLLLQDIVLEVVKNNYPKTDMADIDAVNALFIEHYLDMVEDIKTVEKIMETFLRKLNQNPTITEHFSTQEQNSTNIAPEQDPKTIQIIASFIEKHKLEGEKFNTFKNVLSSTAEIFSSKNIDENMLNTVLQLTDLEKNIEESFNKGVIEGRNQRIEEQLTQFAVEDGLYSTDSNSSMQSGENGYIERILRGRK